MLEHGTTLPARAAILGACAGGTDAATVHAGPAAGVAGTPDLQGPAIALIGERIGRYLDVPESARGPALAPGKGYRLQDLGSGLYMVTDNAYQSMFLVHEGGQVLELSYHGNGHEPGNILIHAPAQRVLTVVDVVFPGWMPRRRFALAQDIPGYFARVEEIGRHPREAVTRPTPSSNGSAPVPVTYLDRAGVRRRRVRGTARDGTGSI